MTWTFDSSGLPSVEETHRHISESNALFEEMRRRGAERWAELSSYPHYVIETDGLRAIVALLPSTGTGPSE